jgi:hypothetical protein
LLEEALPREIQFLARHPAPMDNQITKPGPFLV